MIKDPCKQAKCISYPICIQRKSFHHCGILNNAITEYIHKETPPNEYKTISPSQASYISKHMRRIFPRFEWMDYFVDKNSVGVIDRPKRSFLVTIFYEVEEPYVRSYSYSETEENND
jgi:hypothetical protein